MRSAFSHDFSVCCILVLGLLTGCTQPARSPLQLVTWFSPDEKAWLETQIAEFSRQNRRIKVELVACHTADECRLEYDSRLRQGRAPDVCMITARDFSYWTHSGKFRDLLPWHPDEKSFLPETWRVFVSGGRLYAIPCGWSALMLYYNRTIFERHGVPLPRSSWDWGDLLTAAQSLTVWDEQQAATVQYGLEISPSVETWASFIWQNHGELIRADGTWVLTDPQFLQSNLQAIEFYADLIREHGVAPPPDREKFRTGNLFLSRKAAMTFGHREFGCHLQKLNRGEWDVAMLPQGRRKASLLEVWGYTISSQSKQPEDAWKLISFLTRETGQTAMIQGGGWAPSRQLLLASKVFMDFPGSRPVRNSVLVDSLAVARLPPQVPYWEKAEAILMDEMTSLMLNDRPATRTTVNVKHPGRFMILPRTSARAILERMQARLDEQKLLYQNLKQNTSDPTDDPKRKQ